MTKCLSLLPQERGFQQQAPLEADQPLAEMGCLEEVVESLSL
jgi:hypothetical protein